jgi:hypothetical protein
MDASTLNLKQIFEPDRRYLVPLFQRPYVWGADSQWAPLWDDVRHVAERVGAGREVKPHFLGAIVLDHVRQPISRVEARLIVDGQQRLTTLQLLLEAASDICRERKYDRYHRAFLKLTRNEDPLSDDPNDEFKVWPTNADREAFCRVMAATSPDDLIAAGRHHPEEVGRPIPQAYVFFSGAIRKWLDGQPQTTDASVGHLYTALREYIRLVVIELGESDDPQLIFETLNARGTPLLPADLVKNYLFLRAQREGLRPEYLYTRHWQAIEEDAAYWRENVVAGRVKRSRLDLFLQHYLTMRTGEEVQVAHLYATFRTFLDKTDLTPEDHLSSLAKYAQLFRGFDEFDAGSSLGGFFTRLEDLEITTVHPLLLFLFGLEGVPSTAIEQITLDLECSSFAASCAG